MSHTVSPRHAGARPDTTITPQGSKHMLFVLFRGRHGPLLRAAAGIAVIVAGLVDSAAFLVVIGALLLAWAAAAGAGQLTRRRRGPGAAGPRRGGPGPSR